MVQVSGTDELCPDYKNSNSENKKVCPLEKRHWANRISKYCPFISLYFAGISLIACMFNYQAHQQQKTKQETK